MARRRSRHRFSRMRHRVHHRPKMLSKLITAGGLLIAFNPEIGSVARDFQSGTLISNPQQALSNLAYNSVGIEANGTINAAALTASITSKVGGYIFVKVARFFVKRLGRL